MKHESGGASGFVLYGVHQSGKKFKACISIELLVRLLIRGIIQYCTATQRGQFTRSNPDDDINDDYTRLLPITYENLLIDSKKAMEMAFKILKDELAPDDVIWNVRKEQGFNTVVYDEEALSLLIDGIVTMPDSAHRHRAYLYAYEWATNPSSIPESITVDEQTVKQEEIMKVAKSFDVKRKIFVTVHNRDETYEGVLFDQYNTPQKTPNTAQSIKVNSQATPSRRFLARLMAHSVVFSKDEVERNRTSIALNSRKLVPNSTLHTAIKKSEKVVKTYEKDPAAYVDLVKFVGDFFYKLASHYVEMRPGANYEVRKNSRDESYIIKPIMFIPLMKIAFETWEAYHKNSTIQWQTDKSLDELIAKLAKKVPVKDPKSGVVKDVNIMSKENLAWVGKIVNEKLQISNNRLSQQAAYEYLTEEIDLKQLVKKLSKGSKKRAS
ncbi:ParB N-terminal domain-containing protein [Niallia taxi]|uniref:hypothetical protein n=1 Tax=Niallia taxi TaxID=2499688 RepID=UPI0015F4ACCE|nr:hypothetical protein [Niallia taxi]